MQHLRDKELLRTMSRLAAEMRRWHLAVDMCSCCQPASTGWQRLLLEAQAEAQAQAARAVREQRPDQV